MYLRRYTHSSFTNSKSQDTKQRPGGGGEENEKKIEPANLTMNTIGRKIPNAANIRPRYASRNDLLCVTSPQLVCEKISIFVKMYVCV